MQLCGMVEVWYLQFRPGWSANMFKSFQIHDIRTIFEQFPTVSHQGPKMFWGWFNSSAPRSSLHDVLCLWAGSRQNVEALAHRKDWSQMTPPTSPTCPKLAARLQDYNSRFLRKNNDEMVSVSSKIFWDSVLECWANCWSCHERHARSSSQNSKAAQRVCSKIQMDSKCRWLFNVTDMVQLLECNCLLVDRHGSCHALINLSSAQDPIGSTFRRKILMLSLVSVESDKTGKWNRSQSGTR